jgi:hypothetical protein
VDTCADDDSPGSLRTIIEDTVNTGDGDTIDLMHLPMACSKITLDGTAHSPSYITVAQPNLHLLGPGSWNLTLDGHSYYGVLRHVGFGTLTIEGMTIAHGKYVSDNAPFGGCVYSKGSIDLELSVIDHCTAFGTSSVGAAGGGVYAKKDLTMSRSSINASGAYNQDSIDANGGGAFVGGNFNATYASISNNYASGGGGGAHVKGALSSIASSTISSNLAKNAGGLYFRDAMGTADIVNSTISGNEATSLVGALVAAGNLNLANSTVAFNHDRHYANFAAVSVFGGSLVLNSSIIADNSEAIAPADLWVSSTTTFIGAHNLIVAPVGVQVPVFTIMECPHLDPLASNGGPTLTHAIRPTSAAVDAGSSPPSLLFDQTGYSRVVGIAADIGAFEWRNGAGTDRVFVNGFDGLCDQ